MHLPEDLEPESSAFPPLPLLDLGTVRHLMVDATLLWYRLGGNGWGSIAVQVEKGNMPSVPCEQRKQESTRRTLLRGEERICKSAG